MEEHTTEIVHLQWPKYMEGNASGLNVDILAIRCRRSKSSDGRRPHLNRTIFSEALLERLQQAMHGA